MPQPQVDAAVPSATNVQPQKLQADAIADWIAGFVDEIVSIDLQIAATEALSDQRHEARLARELEAKESEIRKAEQERLAALASATEAAERLLGEAERKRLEVERQAQIDRDTAMEKMIALQQRIEDREEQDRLRVRMEIEAAETKRRQLEEAARAKVEADAHAEAIRRNEMELREIRERAAKREAEESLKQESATEDLRLRLERLEISLAARASAAAGASSLSHTNPPDDSNPHSSHAGVDSAVQTPEGEIVGRITSDAVRIMVDRASIPAMYDSAQFDVATMPSTSQVIPSQSQTRSVAVGILASAAANTSVRFNSSKATELASGDKNTSGSDPTTSSGQVSSPGQISSAEFAAVEDSSLVSCTIPAPERTTAQSLFSGGLQTMGRSV
eukprot:jgi/Hompol1/6928/HPOL_002120-RA